MFLWRWLNPLCLSRPELELPPDDDDDEFMMFFDEDDDNDDDVNGGGSDGGDGGVGVGSDGGDGGVGVGVGVCDGGGYGGGDSCGDNRNNDLELTSTHLFTISQCQEGVCSLPGLRNQNANIVPEKNGGYSSGDMIIDTLTEKYD